MYRHRPLAPPAPGVTYDPEIVYRIYGRLPSSMTEYANA
jgi:hypothetical protein